METAFDRRIPETQVAAIMATIASSPNRREHPKPDDIQGDFTFWFDGGACAEHTGSRHYFFADGTTAMLAWPATWLWAKITFPNGEVVEVIQHRRV